MDEKIIATYGLYDELLHALHHQEDPQGQMSDAEVLTTAFTVAFFFRGNLESASLDAHTTCLYSPDAEQKSLESHAASSESVCNAFVQSFRTRMENFAL